MTTYPTLRLGVLQALVELKAAFDHAEGLFDLAECPYDKETVEALKTIFKVKIVEKVVEKVVVEKAPRGRPAADNKLSAEDEKRIEESVRDLLVQLNSLGDGEKMLDTQTKIQIIKTKAVLIEQITKIRERWYNVKRVAHFKAVVMGVLDDLVGETDREEFLRRIEPFTE